MNRLIIPYGTEGVPAQLQPARAASDALAPSCAAEVGAPGAPVVSVPLGSLGAYNQGTPKPKTSRGDETLRMSDLRHPFALPPLAQDLAHAKDQLACLRAHLIKLCGMWSKPQVAFTLAYLEAVQAHVTRHEAALTARIGDLAGLIEPAHWCFAAPMPLPRAHLGLDADGRLSGTPERWIRVDFLFRTGAGLLALDLARGHQMASRRRELQDLEAAGVTVQRQAEELPKDAGLLSWLGPDFTGFANAVALPDSPFHGLGLPAPV